MMPLLDEPTASIDTVGEEYIIKALKALSGKKTVFISTHHPSILKYADNILVLQDGRIVEEGIHEELISRGRIYREMFSADES